jgi:putative SOS response-associated peptidase YedK
MDAMIWGLIPYWAKEPDPKRFRGTFNARAETLDTVPSFSGSFLRRRCLVPASAFVEFPVLDGKKVAHRITSADGGPILFAGLWDRWRGGDEEIYTFTIVTTEPNDGLRWLHHRIPVVLTRDAQEVWMDPASPPQAARRVLKCPDPASLSAMPL